MTLLKRVLQDEDGASMVEYAVMIALIAAVSIGVVTTLGTTVSGVFSTVNASVSAV